MSDNNTAELQASQFESQGADVVTLHNVTSHWTGPSNYDVDHGFAAQAVHGPSATSSSTQNSENITEVIPSVSPSSLLHPSGIHFQF